MGGERKTKLHTFLDDEGTNTAGTGLNVNDFDFITVWIGAPSTTGTVKCRGSIKGTEPSAADWAAAASQDKRVDGIAIVPLESAASVVKGDTGVVLAAATHGKLYRVNTEGLRWLNFITSSMTGGEFLVEALGGRKSGSRA